jgi:hypothetical protein
MQPPHFLPLAFSLFSKANKVHEMLNIGVYAAGRTEIEKWTGGQEIEMGGSCSTPA